MNIDQKKYEHLVREFLILDIKDGPLGVESAEIEESLYQTVVKDLAKAKAVNDDNLVKILSNMQNILDIRLLFIDLEQIDNEILLFYRMRLDTLLTKTKDNQKTKYLVNNIDSIIGKGKTRKESICFLDKSVKSTLLKLVSVDEPKILQKLIV